uniref:Uncharacterized protein n=1 Tax=Oryctolagus cuniculus TaxID=9986 RepID=A0A5F9C324_RABIT
THQGVFPNSQKKACSSKSHTQKSAVSLRSQGWVCSQESRAGRLGLSSSMGGGPRGRTKAPMALAWPERSSWSWRCPRRYRYSMRRTSERGRLACSRNSARTRASAPGFPRPARSSSRYRLRTCLWSLLCRLMAAVLSRRETGSGT